MQIACGRQRFTDFLPDFLHPFGRLISVRSALARERQPEAQPIVTEQFDREHVRLMTDKLSAKVQKLESANRRLSVIVPITLLLMSFILYSAFDSWKWVGLILAVVALSPLGGFLSLLLTGTHFSVSSGLGFLALIGVSVEIGVIMVEYINQLRTRGMNPREAAREGAILRLRPIMMTMLVATLGLLPAAMSHDIGSDSQRPFAIVIVGGLIVELFISIVMLPALYVFWARKDDKLPPPEMSFQEEGEHVD